MKLATWVVPWHLLTFYVNVVYVLSDRVKYDPICYNVLNMRHSFGSQCVINLSFVEEIYACIESEPYSFIGDSQLGQTHS